MTYKWDEIPDDFEKMNPGIYVLQAFKAYETENKNGKPYLAVKFAFPESVSLAQENNDYDNDGFLQVFPHTTINIYYETDFGKRQLKQMLKYMFGEENLHHLIDNKTICLMINRKMPTVKAEVEENGDFTNIKNFSFQPLEKPAETETKLPDMQNAKRQRPKDITPGKTAQETQAETAASEPDLPF